MGKRPHIPDRSHNCNPFSLVLYLWFEVRLSLFRKWMGTKVLHFLPIIRCDAISILVFHGREVLHNEEHAIVCFGKRNNLHSNEVQMREVKKPWGKEVIWADTANYVGKILHINAGHRLSLQFHRVKEETIYVLSGILYVYDNEGKITRLTPGQTFHVKPLQVHRFGANECNVQIMEVSTPHLDDVVRLDDDYQR